MKHYETVDFDAIMDALRCDPIIKNFKMEHDNLAERKYLTVNAPRMSNNLDVVK